MTYFEIKSAPHWGLGFGCADFLKKGFKSEFMSAAHHIADMRRGGTTQP
jgi:hypothetical protein